MGSGTPGAGGELLALALTLVIEVPVYATLLGCGWGVPWRRGAAAGVVVNLVSHPVAFLLVDPGLRPSLGSTGALAVVEVVVAWLGEAAMLWAWLRRDPVGLAGVSFVANALSFGLGVAVLAVF